MSSLSKWIESKGWEHDRFLLIITSFMALGILLFAVLLLIWTSAGIITSDNLQLLLLEVGRAILIGILTGLLLGSALILPDYLRKNKDPHNFVPKFLLRFLSIIVSLYLLSFLLGTLFGVFGPEWTLRIHSFNYGVGFGGMVPILSYSAEAKKVKPSGEIKI